MAAYVIFIKERTHNQGEVDLYKEMAPAALADHPSHSASRTDTRKLSRDRTRRHDDARISDL